MSSLHSSSVDLTVGLRYGKTYFISSHTICSRSPSRMDHVVPCFGSNHTLHIPEGSTLLGPVEAALTEINSGEQFQRGDTVVPLHLAGAVDKVSTEQTTMNLFVPVHLAGDLT